MAIHGFVPYFGYEIGRRDGIEVFLAVAYGVNVRDYNGVTVGEGVSEFFQEMLGATVLVGLEYGEDVGFRVFVADSSEGFLDFGGMMGVVVDHTRIAEFWFFFHTAPSTREGFEGLLDGFW